MTVHVLLMRHARSIANVAGTLAGRAEGVHLDEVGVGQANALVQRLEGVALSVVIGSPMERCRQTVTPVLEARAMQYVEDERLTECDYGSWTGRSLADCALDPLWEKIQRTPSQVVFPDGEAMQAMADRSVAAVRAAVSQARDGDIVGVISHGDPLKAIVADALGMDFDRFQRIVIDPASVTLIRYTEDRAFLVRLNDSASLLRDLMNSNTDAAPGGGAGGGGATSASTPSQGSL